MRTALFAAVLLLPSAAAAQAPPPLPPEQRPLTYRGTIVATRPFRAQLLTGDGRYHTLVLHRGTVINPTGTKLAVGMHVSATGADRDPDALDADRIELAPDSIPALRRRHRR